VSTRPHQVVIEDPSVQRAAEGIRVDYAIHNSGDTSVYLFSLLFDVEPSGVYVLQPERAYGELEGPGSLVVSKMLFAVPDGVSVEFPEIPCIEELGAGCSARQQAVLAGPVRLRVPYRFTPSEAIDSSSIRQVRLRVGFLPRVEGFKIFRAKDARGLPFAYPEYRAALAELRVIETGLLLVSTP
jgi:hypothetical protein